MQLGVDADIYMTNEDDILIACDVKQCKQHRRVII